MELQLRECTKSETFLGSTPSKLFIPAIALGHVQTLHLFQDGHLLLVGESLEDKHGFVADVILKHQ